MNKIVSVLFVVMLIVLLYGCSKEVEEKPVNVTSTVAETIVTSTTEPTTEKTTKATTKAEVTTTKSDTTATSTSAKKPTKSKLTTTKKVTTTQKQTTSKPYYCDEGGSHHRRNVGPIGWYKTYDETMVGVTKYCNKHPNFKHYTVEKCSCGLYTATFTETQTKATTKPYYCDEGGSHHRRDVGQIGWCSNPDEALNATLDYISTNGLGGANYTITKCSCGKYTAYIN